MIGHVKERCEGKTVDINIQERKKREKERKQQAEKFWEERDEEDIGEGLTGDSRSDARPERTAVSSHATAGKIIGKLSSKSLAVLDKPTVSPEIPFTRGSEEGKDQNSVSSASENKGYFFAVSNVDFLWKMYWLSCTGKE